MKCIRKFTPVSPYDIQGLESWLQDLALQGLYLAWFRPLFSTFVQDTPRQVRYRVEFCKEADRDGPPQDLKDLYRDFGWDYVGRAWDSTLLIFRTRDSRAEELHTDPMTQSYVFDRYLKRHLRAFFAFLVLALGQLAYTIGFDRDSLTLTLPNFLEQLVLDTQYVVPFLLADLWSLLVITPVVYFRFWKLWKLRDKLAMGVPLEEGQRHPRSLARTVAFFAVPITLWCVGTLGVFIPPYQQTALTPDRPTPAPLVSLYDLELDPAIQDPEFRSNLVETSLSPLAVKQDLNQWTYWEEPDDPTASISIDYVDAVSPTFAGWVLDSWKRTDEVEDGIPWQEASRPGLDRLYIYIEVPVGPSEYDVGDHHYTVNQFADTYYWLGQAGDQVFRLTVRGTVPPEEALALLLERMGAAS